MLKQNLVSFHIIERESNRRSLITWTYPTLTDELATFIKARCFPTHLGDRKLFFYLRKNNLWVYIKQFSSVEKRNALIVIADELLPAKYKLVCEILVKNYKKTKNPVDLVKLFIKLVSGSSAYCQENGTEIGLNLKTFAAEVGIKDIISDFGLEIILIYNAILLKRRILVFHQDIEKLQEKLIAVTYLVPPRTPNEYLAPWVKNINEIKNTSFYVAGITDPNIASNERYYDLHVDLAGNEINISKGAKDCFVMAKIHKDVAHFLVELSQSDLSEVKVSEQIKNKTNDILRQLYSIATSRDNKKLVTISDLKSKKYNPPLENFLFNLAVAENIMML